MLNVNMLLASDLWSTVISWFASWIVNYGWTIIVFTIALKLLMSPLDILQRTSSQKQTRFMSAMQPEMAILQQKYGNDKQRLNQEQAKLYKKYNVNVGGMCFTMFITLGLSLLIFGTLYGSLRSFGEEKMYESYAKLDAVCIEAQAQAENNSSLVDENAKIEFVKDEIIVEYKKQQKENSWLWVKNVWRGDTNTSQIVELKAYAKYKKIDKNDADLISRNEIILDAVDEVNPGQNGYYILLVLAGVISFLTQFLSTKLLAPKGQKLNTMNKVMMAVIPLTMVIFASTSNTVFTLYIITNSLMTAIISTIISLVMKSKNKGKTDTDILLPKKNIEVVEYSRNYKK